MGRRGKERPTIIIWRICRKRSEKKDCMSNILPSVVERPVMSK